MVKGQYLYQNTFNFSFNLFSILQFLKIYLMVGADNATNSLGVSDMYAWKELMCLNQSFSWCIKY